MKCPKCNYTSFDYNQVCPKCGNDNAEEQSRLKLSPNKPNPPFFLASLVGMADSENLEIPVREAGMGTPESTPGGMDAQDLLIALDDLEPASDMEEMPEKAQEVDLFLTNEPDSVEMPTEKTDPAKITHTPEESDSQELFLSLDDLPDSDAKTEPSASSGVEEDGILFELEEASDQESVPVEKETPDEKGFWNSDEIDEQLAAFGLEEATTEKKDASPKDNADGKEDVNLFSDKDIEPLDLELSLEDMGKKPD